MILVRHLFSGYFSQDRLKSNTGPTSPFGPYKKVLELKEKNHIVQGKSKV
jgi:hypothetical protein